MSVLHAFVKNMYDVLCNISAWPGACLMPDVQWSTREIRSQRLTRVVGLCSPQNWVLRTVLQADFPGPVAEIHVDKRIMAIRFPSKLRLAAVRMILIVGLIQVSL